MGLCDGHMTLPLLAVTILVLGLIAASWPNDPDDNSYA